MSFVWRGFGGFEACARSGCRSFGVAPAPQAPAGFPESRRNAGGSVPGQLHCRGPVRPACYSGNPNTVGAATPKPSSNRQMGMFAFSRVVNPQFRTLSSPSNVNHLIRGPHRAPPLHPRPHAFMTKQDEKPAKKARPSEDAPAAASKAQAKTEGGLIWLNLSHKWGLGGGIPLDSHPGWGRRWAVGCEAWQPQDDACRSRAHTPGHARRRRGEEDAEEEGQERAEAGHVRLHVLFPGSTRGRQGREPRFEARLAVSAWFAPACWKAGLVCSRCTCVQHFKRRPPRSCLDTPPTPHAR